jgi:hypothetical protein
MTFIRPVKMLCILALALTAGLCIAAEPSWNPADPVKEAEQDLRAGNIKFYLAGSIASRPVSVRFEVAKNYQKANAGVGCVTNDIPFPERQEEYARRYNEKIYAYITQKRYQPRSIVILRAPKNL